MSSATAALVTIGVPTYARYDKLRNCLEQVIAQEYRNIEIFVSDNTHDQQTPQWLSELAKHEPRLRYVKQAQNLGMMRNHQFLLSNARGDLFCWLHDDDCFPVNYISSVVTEMSAHPQLSLVGSACARYFEGTFWYEYENYSSLEKTQEERLVEIAVRAFRSPNSFEHLVYGVFRKERLPRNYSFAYWRSIILFFFLLSIDGPIHSVSRSRLVKNTTQAELDRYAKPDYLVRNPLLRRVMPFNLETRTTVAARLLKFVTLSKSISVSLKLRLYEVVMAELIGNTPEYVSPAPPVVANRAP